jgi:hypothetical protein
MGVRQVLLSARLRLISLLSSSHQRIDRDYHVTFIDQLGHMPTMTWVIPASQPPSQMIIAFALFG